MAKVNPETECLLTEARNLRIINAEQLDKRLQEHNYLHNVLLLQFKQENDNKIDALIKEAQVKIDATRDNPNQRFYDLHNLHIDICNKLEQYTNIIESIFNELYYANQVINGTCVEESPILVGLNDLCEQWQKSLQDSKAFLKITQEHRGEIEIYARNENQIHQYRQNQIKLDLIEQIQGLKLHNILEIKKIEEYGEWKKAQICLQHRGILNQIEVELAEKVNALHPLLNVLDEHESSNAIDFNPVPLIGESFELNNIGNPEISEILD